MTPEPPARIFLDVGSTNSRAWLVRDGQIIDSRSLPVGVRDSAREGHTGGVRRAIAELVRALAPPDGRFVLAAAGMISSAQGIAEIPHITAPASAQDLARASVATDVPDIAPVPLVLVPGIRTTDAGGVCADVMRGEETLVVGLLDSGMMTGADLLLNAGSHWKLIALDDQDRIARSRTSLGGEVVHAVQTATLLSASLPAGPLSVVLPDWLEAGATAADEHGLLRALFSVRLLDQRGGLTPEERFAWMAGACIGDDVRALARAGMLPPGVRVLVSGPGGIPASWAHLLRRQGCEPLVLDAGATERAFVAGLSRIMTLLETSGGEADLTDRKEAR